MENTVYCHVCLKKLNLKNRLAFAFYEGTDPCIGMPAHWTCMAGHKNKSLIAIKRAKWEKRPLTLDHLKKTQLAAAKTIAKKTFNGKCRKPCLSKPPSNIVVTLATDSF